MSDLPELLEAVTIRLTAFVNDGIEASGGEPFGLGDLRPIAAELIDYTLNREFGDGIGASAEGWTTPSNSDLAIPTGGAGAPNPSNCQLCGAGTYDVISICGGVCVSCETPHRVNIIASGIKARSDATPKSDAAEGESPVPKGDANA